MALSTNDFRTAIQDLLAKAERDGKKAVIVVAGDLHRQLGDYPGPNHRMPACCGAMRSLMRAGDTIVDGPQKGNGASLAVRYVLPRG